VVIRKQLTLDFACWHGNEKMDEQIQNNYKTTRNHLFDDEEQTMVNKARQLMKIKTNASQLMLEY